MRESQLCLLPTGTRTRLILAATVWLAAALMLLVRGVLFIEAPTGAFHPTYALVPVAIVAAIVGVIKARLILIDYARANVERVTSQPRASLLAFFSLKSWIFIAVMMGGGVALRHSFLAESGWGRTLLAVLYLAVATALLVADRVLWAAALGPAVQVEPAT